MGLALFTVISAVIQKAAVHGWAILLSNQRLMKMHPDDNVCNYQKPAAGEPALLLWDDVITLFHEFGYTLHGLFARQRYATRSPARTTCRAIFVEFPSQINGTLGNASAGIRSLRPALSERAAMPPPTATKMRNASLFNKG